MEARMKLRPKDFTEKQKLAYKYALNNPYCILALSPRLGKSGVALSVREKLKSIGRPSKCLIICPSYLTPNWRKEIEKWTTEKDITSFTKGKDIKKVSHKGYVIISFDLAMKAEFLFDWCDCLIIDEVHNLKSTESKRSQIIHRCIFEYAVKRVMLLSGTILKNRVREFYSPIAITYYNPKLDKPKFLEEFPDEISFADEFSHRMEFQIKGTTKYGRYFRSTVVKYTGLKNLIKLKKYLKGRYIKLEADDNDLPPISEVKIQVSDIDNKDLLQAFDEFYADEGNHSVKSDIKVQAAMAKVPFTIKYVEDLLTKVDCVLIYSDHVEPITAIAAHFKVKPITGKVTGKKRGEMAGAFQKGEGTVLCATIGALKEGQDLFRSRDIVLNDYPWVPGDLKQVINRVRKLGEKEPRFVHYVLGSPQDSKILALIKQKERDISAAT